MKTENKLKLLERVRQVFRVKHYSYKTEKSYIHRIHEYIRFHKNRHPFEMAELEVQEYLTWLATDRHVAASTQNQAFCALLFLYRYVLEKPLVDKIDAVRAKRPKRLPIVLSKKEVASLLSIADTSSKLFILLLYGCGLRLRELLNLRINTYRPQKKVLDFRLLRQ